MPELLDVLEGLGLRAPVTPRIRCMMQRLGGAPYDAGVEGRAVATEVLDDAQRERRHPRSAEVGGDLVGAHREARMRSEPDTVAAAELAELLAGRGALKGRLCHQRHGVPREHEVAVHLHFDVRIEGPSVRAPRGGAGRWVFREPRDESADVEPRRAQRLARRRDALHECRKDRLEGVRGPDVHGPQMAVTPREGGAREDLGAKLEVARAKAGARAVGVVHHVQAAILRAVFAANAGAVIRTAEQITLPDVALATWERRPTPVGDARHKLVFVAA